jgi:hypothetical protein
MSTASAPSSTDWLTTPTGLLCRLAHYADWLTMPTGSRPPRRPCPPRRLRQAPTGSCSPRRLRQAPTSSLRRLTHVRCVDSFWLNAILLRRVNCTTVRLRLPRQPSRQRGSHATLHGLTTGYLSSLGKINSPLSTFERATRNGQVVQTRILKLNLGSSTKNANQEPSLESHARLAFRAKTDGSVTRTAPCPQPWIVRLAMAKYYGRGFANRTSDRPGKTSRQEPSLESPRDWPHGPREVTMLIIQHLMPSSTLERAIQRAK